MKPWSGAQDSISLLTRIVAENKRKSGKKNKSSVASKEIAGDHHRNKRERDCLQTKISLKDGAP